MQPFEALSKEDCSNIEKYIEYYATNNMYSPSRVSVEIPYILRFWNKNKQFLFELFGNKLILQKNINIQYPETFLIEEMEETFYQEDGNTIKFFNEINSQCSRTICLNIKKVINKDKMGE